MEKHERRNNLGEPRKEATWAAEERMEDVYGSGGRMAEFEEGEVVRGRVVHIGTGEVLVDVGYKSEGAIPVEEFRGNLPKVGEDIDVYLEAKEDSEGLIVLSKEKADKIRVWDAITQAYDKGTPVEGRIVEVVKGGLAVDVGVKAFLPGSQVDLRPVKNLASLVGQHVRSKVIKLNRRRGNVVLSRRAVLEEEREDKQKHTDPWENVEQKYPAGHKARGRVVSLTNYGAFIELEAGVEGLVHVSEMSWTRRVRHPSKLVNVGEEVDVVVLDVNRGAKRISLGMKQVEADPWTTIEERHQPGNRVTGRVRNLTDSGAFMQLEPGVDGLLHISQMSNRPIGTPAEVVNVGDELALLVIRVDPNERRIGLSLKELAHAVDLSQPDDRGGQGRGRGKKKRRDDYDYDDEE